MSEATPEHLAFLDQMIEKLDATPRSGWIDRGIPREIAESIGDHTRQVTTSAINFAYGRDVNLHEVAVKGICHDLGEYLFGDPLPGQYAYAVRHAGEEEGIRYIERNLGLDGELYTHQIDFEERKSDVAKIVRAADLVDASIRVLDIKNNFGCVRTYFAAHPEELEKSKTRYAAYLKKDASDITDDELFTAMLTRLDEFHPYNRNKVEIPEFQDILELMLAYNGADPFNVYNDLLLASQPGLPVGKMKITQAIVRTE